MAKRIYSHLLIGILFLSAIGIFLSLTPGCNNIPITSLETNASFLENFKEPQKRFSIDLDNDGTEETGKINKGIAYIYKNNELIFTSDPSWDVKEILAGDFNNDGQNDFALSLWKYGNYGNSLPFWEEKNDNSYKMHLFLYTWKREKIGPLWHSSNLPKQNLRTRLIDTNNDGQNELIVIETDYQNSHDHKSILSQNPDMEDASGLSIAQWTWNDWGFELQKRIQTHWNFITNF
ncbi:hypothetical protein GF366_03435 [Candidatus Peregrinibacteria bacterium]|nr:hypothetical protein [Candidatus Peregrinibacteria bacterium]